MVYLNAYKYIELVNLARHNYFEVVNSARYSHFEVVNSARYSHMEEVNICNKKAANTSANIQPWLTNTDHKQSRNYTHR